MPWHRFMYWGWSLPGMRFPRSLAQVSVRTAFECCPVAPATIRDLIGRSNSARAESVTEFAASRARYDRGFCINVLSVIPFLAERKKALALIRMKLKPGGQCLFVVQYRNSEFTKMARSKNAMPWRDGILLKSLRGYSFYGLIPPVRLAKTLAGAGFKVISTRLNEGSVYIWAST